jgi:hypothetical protein
MKEILSLLKHTKSPQNVQNHENHGLNANEQKAGEQNVEVMRGRN